MPTHSHVAAAARRSKDEHPERYCWHPRCLFRTWNGQRNTFTVCPTHGHETKEENHGNDH